ncbi:YagK/YfjJ domain-containing protein [Photobacterium ganghwense]|uniref:YagK/YfjJ domain-containing protein n=1 Tax=Photobacterium ganghwense TaxID=320778 RepID=UPI00405693B8
MDQLSVLLTHYSRLLMIRVDFKCLASTTDNKYLSVFMRKLVVCLKKQYRCLVGYTWVREQVEDKAPHYHTALFLNGHKVNHPSSIIKRIMSMIEDQQTLNVYIPKNCYYPILRHCERSQQAAIYRLSYLAKHITKGNRPRQTKDYQTSRHRQA